MLLQKLPPMLLQKLPPMLLQKLPPMLLQQPQQKQLSISLSYSPERFHVRSKELEVLSILAKYKFPTQTQVAFAKMSIAELFTV
jgi:hypothetical protein